MLAAKFKELIEDRSDGAVTVTLYENGALGGDAELTESCIAGSVDFIVGMTGSLVNYIPEAALFDLPNVFPDLETAREVLDGPILAELQAAYEAGGLKLFGYADSGFRVMTSSKAVRQMSDFSGIKIRTMENPNHIAYWQALGANPTPADFSELYMSLEQGTLDAQENPYDLIVANKLYEPQAYVIETNHLLHTLNMVGSKATYDALPADIQQLVSECAAEAHQYARQMADERIEGQKSTIQDAGLEIITLEPAMIQEMADVLRQRLRSGPQNKSAPIWWTACWHRWKLLPCGISNIERAGGVKAPLPSFKIILAPNVWLLSHLTDEPEPVMRLAVRIALFPDWSSLDSRKRI